MIGNLKSLVITGRLAAGIVLLAVEGLIFRFLPLAAKLLTGPEKTLG